MIRKDLLQYLATRILNIQKGSPVLVGIDGVDASGKTFLANEIADELKESGRHIIRASIDRFHNPKDIRYAKGENSPEGYYFDSFNHKAIVGVLLNPLSSGKLEYKTDIFDYRTNMEVISPAQEANENSILIMEGVFLLRPELVNYWDLKIYLDVDFRITVKRAINRLIEKEYNGTEQEIVDKYNQRYIPGHRLYIEKVNPKKQSNIIIDNSNFESPTLNIL